MANIIRTVIQFRRAKHEDWLTHGGVIPAAGEPCFDLDLKTLKIGDGETTYENLPAIGGAGVEVAADGKSIVFDNKTFQLAGFDAAEVGAYAVKGEDGNLTWVVPEVTINDLAAEIGTPADTEAGIEATGIYAELESKANVTDIVAINDKIGEVADGKTIIDMISDATYDDAQVKANAAAIAVLNGSGDGSVAKTVDDAINKFAANVNDDGTVNTVKELIDYVADHGKAAADMAADILTLQDLVGGKSVKEQILAADHITKTEAEDTLLSKVEAADVLQHVKYEISHKPVGTLVNYSDKEIRIMCPTDTKWELQNVAEIGDASMYYLGFKAYAPANAVSFKEDTAEIISDDTMYYFENNPYAGIDKYGRKYSICWLAAAKYDFDTEMWSYFGAKSSTSKYIGWYYSVEWYDANGIKIDSDCIRINLSNENCHNVTVPYYMAGVVKGISVGGTLLDVIDGVVEMPANAGLKSSEEIVINEDGTMSIKAISFDKISQGESTLVLDGGGASA